MNTGGSVCELCWQYTESCFHSFGTCKALKNSEDEAIIEAQHIIDELDVNRIAFYNRGLVQENELKLDEKYQPPEEYNLHVKWKRAAPPGPATNYTQERLYEPRGTRPMGPPSPKRWEPRPVLYTAPDWVPDCGVDELLNQVGYTTNNTPTSNRTETARSSTLDNPDIYLEEELENLNTEQAEPEEWELPPEEHNIENHIEEDIPPTINNAAFPNGWPSRYYFGDGSGGKYSKYITISRCGVGLHYVNIDKQPLIDASMPLPGEIQSNNRAEIYAILIAAQNVETV